MNTVPQARFDSGWIGLSLGLIAPLLTLYIFYLVKYSQLSFRQFYTNILLAHNIIVPSISVCVITNLLVFFIFIWTHRNLSARGVIFSTFIYAGYIVYQKCIL
jgi:hypothetical protein